LTYINKLKDDGRTTDEVVLALHEAERRGFGMLPYPRQDEAVAQTRMIPMRAADEAVIAERRIIAILEERIEELKGQLNTSETERESLLRKLIQAETELHMWKDGWRPPIEKGE
jgi:predicted RNase H-like nuclease (RuvC/YqgF family)